MKLPRVSGKQTVETLLRAGFITHRIRGSHYILKHPETSRRVTVPYHRRELALKTLSSILKQAAVSPETFSNLL
ncbi:MAG: type II toxin-antitoxin system HicA family toxin [Dehalococcoidia bacterium]|nr:type II toxin-antitoxin system HicA family toxin [Dehalococcoidia bacterium]